MAGRVFGNSRADIVGGTIRGSIYGGGSFASVGYEGNENSGHTYVNIGLPGADPSDKSQATGSATIMGEVFGANNHSGTPFGNTNVNIYKTAHTGANTCPTNAYAMTLAAPTDGLNGADVELLPTAATNFAIAAVYGGGNRAAHQPLASTGTTLVHVWYCEENTIHSLYGGGNAANTNNNHLVVDGGRIYEVFGGGNGYGNHVDPNAEDYNQPMSPALPPPISPVASSPTYTAVPTRRVMFPTLSSTSPRWENARWQRSTSTLAVTRLRPATSPPPSAAVPTVPTTTAAAPSPISTVTSCSTSTAVHT